MFDFPSNVRNGVKKRIADVNVKQFEASEFNIICKDVSLGKALLTHSTSCTLYEGVYRGSVVAVKVAHMDTTDSKDMINTLVDLTAMATFPHENIAAFFGAGHLANGAANQEEASVCLGFDVLARSKPVVVNVQIMVVTEPFERGTLRHVLRGSLDWMTKLNIVRDVTRSLAYLHSKYMIHG
jgi:serine/threonine protein kinase